MKEMIYSAERKLEILYEEVIDGRQCYIVSLGTHPCAYIEMKEEDSMDLEQETYVHGGITWFNKQLSFADNNSEYMGWDYSHVGDFSGFSLKFPPFLFGDMVKEKGWHTKEIYEELLDVLEQLKEVEHDV